LRRTGAIGARIVPVLVTLVLAARDQCLQDGRSGRASVEIAEKERETGGKPKGNGTGQRRPKGRNRRTPDEGKPEEGGRRGRTQLGKRETGGKPGREPEDVR